MARIENDKGHYFELKPVAYQFESGDDIYDLNWLEIQIAADNGKYQWTTTDPALMTTEVSGLIEWLRSLAANDPQMTLSWYAMEPCLECKGNFEKGVTELYISLGYDFLPPTLYQSRDYDQRERINFEGDGAQLLSFALQLENELRAFPVRQL